jgi:23S rRNA pseudouridine2604 synthase
MYLKYWKPEGVTCTSDLSDRNNIISFGKFNTLSQRVFTVGRLDKESTGLILLTSGIYENICKCKVII